MQLTRGHELADERAALPSEGHTDGPGKRAGWDLVKVTK